MYNELFENILQASGENMDDFIDEPNFYARISENLLFEQILREMTITKYQFFGIFKSEILENPTASITALHKSSDFEEIIRKFDAEQRYVDCVILPCTNNGKIISQNANKLQSILRDIAVNKEKTYDATLQYVRNYRRALSNRGLLTLTQKLNTDLQNDEINDQQAMETRTNADPKNN